MYYIWKYSKRMYELSNLTSRKNQYYMKYRFNRKVSCFVLNFKGALLNCTRNILPVHWNNYLLFRSEYEQLLHLRAEILGVYETASRSFEHSCYINKFLPHWLILCWPDLRKYVETASNLAFGPLFCSYTSRPTSGIKYVMNTPWLAFLCVDSYYLDWNCMWW